MVVGVLVLFVRELRSYAFGITDPIFIFCFRTFSFGSLTILAFRRWRRVAQPNVGLRRSWKARKPSA